MKKIYLAPQTEAIAVVTDQVLMASGGFISTNLNINYGTPGAGGSPR